MGDFGVDTVLSWRGRTVRDRDGDKLGKLGDVYLDAETDRPAYAGVRTGLFGTRESILPLNGIVEDEDGDLRVPYDAELIRGAPHIDPEAALTPEEEAQLDAHYRSAPRGDAPAGGSGGAEMTRSEEVATVRPGPMVPTERVRLRKVLVTEEVPKTVPLRREVIQLETDPAPEGTVESVEELEGRPADVGERPLGEDERPAG